MPQEKRIQRTTGSNESKQSFPLTLRIDPYEGDSEISLSDTTTALPCYALTLWVFTNMSGMLLITADGLIVDCNAVFSQLALGYIREQLIGKVSKSTFELDSTLIFFLAMQMLSDVLLNFSEPQPGHFSSEVHHENGSFIPVSYFINGPVEGTDIYQVWMAIASPVNNKSIQSLGLSELTLNQSVRYGVLSFFCNLSMLLMQNTKPCETDGSQSKDPEANEEMYSGEFLEHYQVLRFVRRCMLIHSFFVRASL